MKPGPGTAAGATAALASILTLTALESAAALPVPVHTRNTCADGRGTRQEEPAVAVRDSVVVVAWNDNRGLCPSEGYLPAGWSYSVDGGGTFHEGSAFPGGTRWGFDQWLAVGPDGAFYHAALSSESPSPVHGVLLSRGVVDGSSVVWSEPIAHVPPTGSCDKPGMAIDPESGAIYIAYSLFAGLSNPNSGVWLLRSTDQGQSFLPPVQVAQQSPSAGAAAVFPVVGLDGSLLLAWKAGVNTAPTVTIYFARSTDGGASFSAPLVVGTSCPFDVPGTTGSPVFPQLALDSSDAPSRGTLYLAWQTACPDIGPHTPGDVVVTRSTDQGASWSAPVVANSDGGQAAHPQPTLVVDPEGEVWLFMYKAVGAGTTSLVDLVLTRSRDAGASFDPIVTVTDSTAVWGAENEPDAESHGEYITAVTRGGDVQVAYTDSRHGDPDVYWLQVPREGAGTPPLSLAGSGIFLDPVAPNPTTSAVRLRFGLARPGPVTLVIVDVAGRLVRRVERSHRDPGVYTVDWDLADERGRPAAPGVYLARLAVASATVTRTFVVRG